LAAHPPAIKLCEVRINLVTSRVLPASERNASLFFHSQPCSQMLFRSFSVLQNSISRPPPQTKAAPRVIVPFSTSIAVWHVELFSKCMGNRRGVMLQNEQIISNLASLKYFRRRSIESCNKHVGRNVRKGETRVLWKWCLVSPQLLNGNCLPSVHIWSTAKYLMTKRDRTTTTSCAMVTFQDTVSLSSFQNKSLPAAVCLHGYPKELSASLQQVDIRKACGFWSTMARHAKHFEEEIDFHSHYLYLLCDNWPRIFAWIYRLLAWREKKQIQLNFTTCRSAGCATEKAKSKCKNSTACKETPSKKRKSKTTYDLLQKKKTWCGGRSVKIAVNDSNINSNSPWNVRVWVRTNAN